eukprot:3576534-Rhodomonas_salina.2
MNTAGGEVRPLVLKLSYAGFYTTYKNVGIPSSISLYQPPELLLPLFLSLARMQIEGCMFSLLKTASRSRGCDEARSGYLSSDVTKLQRPQINLALVRVLLVLLPARNSYYQLVLPLVFNLILALPPVLAREHQY